MNEKSLQEIIEKNKKILIAKFQEGFLAGFRDAEQKFTEEFLQDLKSYRHNREILIKDLIEKWEQRMEVE